MKPLASWIPAIVLGSGALFTVGIDTQRTMSLAMPLDEAIPLEIEGYVGRAVQLSPRERAVAGVSDYLLRNYERPGALERDWFTAYVGYYEQQTQGKTIHSPKNCLPGAGWEPLQSRAVQIETTAGTVVVNRYLLQRDREQALVLYWYQGRGRVQANEYRVKWDLLKDAVLSRRTEEALVRVVVPVGSTEDAAFAVASRAAAYLILALARALPSA
jgi:EpsI family protein